MSILLILALGAPVPPYRPAPGPHITPGDYQLQLDDYGWVMLKITKEGTYRWAIQGSSTPVPGIRRRSWGKWKYDERKRILTLSQENTMQIRTYKIQLEKGKLEGTFQYKNPSNEFATMKINLLQPDR